MSFWHTWLPPLESGQLPYVPETVQTSNMDCGPAALKSMLEGFGVSIHYGRLREACQTSVDGTSIDMLETVANQLGLDAHQVIVPLDHLILAETTALPAIVVARLPNGLTHFMVVWRVVDGRVQVMDPRIGRKWLSPSQLQEQLFVHELNMDAPTWRAWAGTEGFTRPLSARLAQIGIASAQCDSFIAQALSDNDWMPLAALDAATRLVTSLIKAEAVATGEAASALIGQLIASVLAAPERALQQIPLPYWFVRLAEGQPNHLIVRGAVLVSVYGVQEEAEGLSDNLSAELTQAIQEPDSQPLWAIWELLRQDGLFVPTVIMLAASLASMGVMLEILVLRGVLDASMLLTLRSQRVNALWVFMSFGVLMVALEYWLSDAVQRMGRHLDTRLRITFLSKIPKLGDRYFHSRLISDMTMRAHELALVRQFPSLGVRFLRVTFQLLLTTIGVIVLIPLMLPVVLGVLIVTIVPGLLMQSMLQEQDLRLRAHSGGLSRFYLDGLLGLVTIKAHSAEKSFQNTHEMLLTEWVKAGRDYNSAALWIQGIQALIGTVAAIMIVLRYLAIGSDPAGLLLLFYWVLNLPQLGQQFANIVLQYPQIRNRVLRIIEPLDAPDEAAAPLPESGAVLPEPARGVAIQMRDVAVEAGGMAILQNIDLQIAGGEHVAVVGASGAGKSSLVGLLLGWYKAARGTVHIDGVPLHGSQLETLRQQTAWVDPTVQIWNQTLLDNLEYGNSAEATAHANYILDQADLYEVLEHLPDGLQTKLGENGGLVAGGEGQRVRLGRAMLRRDARLVILDEPFRGLDRTQRQALLTKIRAHWSEATLFFISHDVGDTQAFDRVLVIDEGRLIEDAAPQMLATQTDSAYRTLLDAEQAVRRDLWESADWRQLRLDDGVLVEVTA